VHVGAVAEGPSVRAWVEDEGPGPLAGEGAALFDRFRRGGTEPEAAGMGLGLWLVKSIIERHGGSVAFERTGAARTRFTLILPLENP